MLLCYRFTKIKNFGASASVLSYAHFQAFKFPDSMEVHFQCTIQICRYQCPEQCSDAVSHGLHNGLLEVHSGPETGYGVPALPLEAYLHRDERRVRRAVTSGSDPEKEVGVNRVIRVVSTGDLTFAIDENNTSTAATTMVFPAKEELVSSGLICMTTIGFAATLIVLLTILVGSCLMSAFLCVKLRPFSGVRADKIMTTAGGFRTPIKTKKVGSSKSCFYS